MRKNKPEVIKKTVKNWELKNPDKNFRLNIGRLEKSTYEKFKSLADSLGISQAELFRQIVDKL